MVPGGIGFKRWQIILTRCISYLDHGVGERSRHIPRNTADGGLIGRFTPVHGPPVPGEGMRPFHMLECWHVKAVMDDKKPGWLSKTVQRRE